MSRVRISEGPSPVQHAAECHEEADHDGRRGGACHLLGLLQHETHLVRLVISTMGHPIWGHDINSDKKERMRVIGR